MSNIDFRDKQLFLKLLETFNGENESDIVNTIERLKLQMKWMQDSRLYVYILIKHNKTTDGIKFSLKNKRQLITEIFYTLRYITFMCLIKRNASFDVIKTTLNNQIIDWGPLYPNVFIIDDTTEEIYIYNIYGTYYVRSKKYRIEDIDIKYVKIIKIK